ncbi:hypothetical protein B0H10DRAFT_2373037 [Mycena sp. CBHHK59/15]|nr:hypothetical protein B0H10DRAFT_2373037 [Mycena sp. CBHHK59/15]
MVCASNDRPTLVVKAEPGDQFSSLHIKKGILLLIPAGRGREGKKALPINIPGPARLGLRAWAGPCTSLGKRKVELDLNPRPGTSRRKTLTGYCKCLVWTGICVGASLCLLAGWVIVSFGIPLVEKTRFSYKYLYPDSDSELLHELKDVISPLLPDHQTFNIAVTVWLCATEEAESKWLNFMNFAEEAPTLEVERLDRIQEELMDNRYPQKVLFSNIVFRGLRLSDRHALAKIDFQLPTARLFPLGSQDRGSKTMADLALESFSVSVLLIEFHGIASQCSNAIVADASLDEEGDVDAPGNHPYVVTRTQLHVVHETTLFDAKVYNKAHSRLRELEVPTESGLKKQWVYAPYIDTKLHAAGPMVNAVGDCPMILSRFL